MVSKHDKNYILVFPSNDLEHNEWFVSSLID